MARYAINRGRDGEDFVFVGGEPIGVITHGTHGRSTTCTIEGRRTHGANGECRPGEQPAWLVKRARAVGLIGARRALGAARVSDPEEIAWRQRFNADTPARELVAEMSRLREFEPRPMHKMFGTNGGTPEQRAAHAAKIRQWQRAMSYLRRLHKPALARDNAAFRAGRLLGARQRRKGFYVVEIDDAGERRLIDGAKTAALAAERAAALVPGIDVADFTASWNATNESGSARYMIGEE